LSVESARESAEELTPRAGYAAWAASYDSDGNPLLPMEGPAMRALWGPVAGRRVLDLGCGTGRHTLDLAEAGARVMALDQSPEMMALARAKLRGYEVGWLLHRLPGALPFPDGRFAMTVLGLVAEHVADLDGLFAEVARVLGSGGRCLVSALHPDRTAEGQRARFIDPRTGERRPITTYHRTADAYHAAAAQARLAPFAERTLVVPAELAARFPRAGRYVGLALGWVACWVKRVEW
jgi:malonyl-CoA O-methyltransferase